MQSYTQQLLQKAALKLGKPEATVSKFIQILEDNWLSSKESFQNIEIQTLQNLGIPIGLGQTIINIVNDELKTKNSTYNQEQDIQQQEIKEPQQLKEFNRDQQQQKEIQLQSFTINNHTIQNQALEICRELKLQTLSLENLINALIVVDKLLYNLIKDPKNEIVRKVKMTNKTIQEKIAPYGAAISLLMLVGFEKISSDLWQIKLENIDQNKIQIISQTLKQFGDQQNYSEQSFNPFIEQQGSVKDALNISKIVQNHQFDPNTLNQKIQEIQQQRMTLIGKIKDRQIRLYKADPSKNINQIMHQIQQQQQEQDFEENNAKFDNSIIQKEIKMASQMMQQSSQFSNARKQEIERILKKQIYKETIIRVKFANGEIFEALFSPFETISDLNKCLEQYLLNPKEPFYVYQSPPVIKMIGQQLYKTFDELNCVPAASFYFSLENSDKNKMTGYFMNEELQKQIQYI